AVQLRELLVQLAQFACPSREVRDGHGQLPRHRLTGCQGRIRGTTRPGVAAVPIRQRAREGRTLGGNAGSVTGMTIWGLTFGLLGLFLADAVAGDEVVAGGV